MRTKKRHSNKRLQLTPAQREFESLKLPNWTFSGGKLKAGGQAKICVVTSSKGQKGVFRTLANKDAKAIARFNREIAILRDFKHPNIINLLELSRDSGYCWYISELGEPFVDFWRTLQEKLTTDNAVFHAVNIIKKICDGLGDLHAKGIVHRDIKPKNLIVVKKEPVLIDFGVAFDPNSERVTDVDEAVGNVRYSPDQMMRMMDNVPPWLDVFMLVQVFIWMITTPSKWQRPLDWKWVQYPSDMTPDLLLRVRALTAICSEQSTAPANARALLEAINNLFTMSKTKTDATSLDLIKRIVENGSANSKLVYSTDLSAFENSYPLFLNFYKSIEARLKAFELEAKEKNIPISFQFNSVEDFEAKVRAIARHNEHRTISVTMGANCGDHPNPIFYVGFQAEFYPPSLNKEWPKNWIPIVLRMYRHSKHKPKTDMEFCNTVQMDAAVIRFIKLNGIGLPVSEESAWNEIKNLLDDVNVWKEHQ